MFFEHNTSFKKKLSKANEMFLLICDDQGSLFLYAVGKMQLECKNSVMTFSEIDSHFWNGS